MEEPERGRTDSEGKRIDWANRGLLSLQAEKVGSNYYIVFAPIYTAVIMNVKK